MEITSQETILKECRQFYEKLYEIDSSVSPDHLDTFHENCTIPQLNGSDSEICEKRISLSELHQTLKSFQKNKAPGIDGLTAELYLKFWDHLGPLLLDVYNEAFERGILPENMRLGLITLLEKKAKDRIKIENWRPITLLGVDYKLLSKCLGERLKKVLPNLIHPDQNGFIPGGSVFFSTHTIRDLLFYCEKEKLDLFMFCIDYTKAFDFLEFGYIHKVFKIFNFKDNFCKWLKIFFNGRHSCISNNGNLSDKFQIQRSTPQGDPISPLIFILALEILFIAIRSDTNIRGVRVEGHEIKLTSFADDATYFIKDETSARKLLSKIDSFSKISGLQINRSKSECLLLQFETIASNYNEKCLGIPVVETVKVLGHHFGHNKLICNYHNFYSKLIKIEKITQIWNQRNLTLFGKNILISALINSQILFNSQIETPPLEFLKMTEKLKKSFLWGGGIPKIAHHSIIGSISDGGINYKDTHSQINSLNLKFIINLNNCKSNRAILPKFWILNFFRKTSNIKEVDKLYFDNQIEQNLDIITKCYFKLPRKNKWKGHPFYFESLNTIQKVNTELPGNFYDLISTPIWYNKFLNTRFDCDLVKKGFIFIKDIVTKGEVLNSESIKNLNISNKFKKKILKICEKLPLNSKNILFENRNLTSIPFPQTTLKIGQINKYLKDLSSKTFYNLLIKNKI